MNEFFIKPAGGGPSQSSLLRPPANYVDTRVLAANTAETHNVPSGARVVLFAATAAFYAKPGAAAVVPAADVTDGTGAELSPVGWTLPANDRITQITMNAPAAAVVTLAFYK